jgi:hypothetical protein
MISTPICGKSVLSFRLVRLAMFTSAYGEVEYDFEGESSKAKSIGLAYTHALSKRTTAYVGYNRTDNDEGLALGPVSSGVRYNALTDVITGTGEECQATRRFNPLTTSGIDPLG